MTYFQNLNRLVLKELELRATHFAESYVEEKKSVILLPGGMGSKLLQCEAAFRPNQLFPPNSAFHEIWVSLAAILRGDIAQLQMDSNEHDRENRPIIAAGEMNTVVKSYDKTEKFFEEENVNYTEFGFDWRREIRAAAGYLRTFLRMIREKVMARGLENPLPELTMFAHSMGGLVGKLFINELIDDDENTEDWFYRFVTVATPFSGTENHMDRYYEGVKFINLLLGGAENVAALVGSLPGPYGLMPAPIGTMEPNFSRLGLDRYPVRDADNINVEVDPYDSESRGRFPPTMVDNYFFRAEDMFQQLHRPLTNDVTERIFHLRNNLPNRGENSLELLWDNVAGSDHDFSGRLPIRINGGASDGSVPFWSARLADTPDSHVYPMRTETDHGELAEDPETLAVANRLVQGQDLPSPGATPSRPGPAVADDRVIETLINAFQAGNMEESELATLSEPVKRGLVKAFSIC